MSYSYRILSGFKDDVYGGQTLSGRFDTRPKFSEVEVTDEPDIEGVTLAEVKQEVNNRHNEHDDMLRSYIKRAYEDVEEFTGRSLITQELTAYWKVAFDYVWLPRPPHVSITSVTEIDDDGTETTITSSEYDLYGRKEFKLEFDSTISDQLRIVYETGYGSKSSDLPNWAMTAIKWQTKLYYEKSPDLAIDAQSGLAMPAYIAAKNNVYLLPE